jgi:hypothetical protein
MIQTRALQIVRLSANVTLLSQLTENVTTEIQGLAGASMGANVTVRADCDLAPCPSGVMDSMNEWARPMPWVDGRHTLSAGQTANATGIVGDKPWR